jgi:hypothetical protein
VAKRHATLLPEYIDQVLTGAPEVLTVCRTK